MGLEQVTGEEMDVQWENDWINSMRSVALMKNKTSGDEVTTPLLLNCHPQYAQWIETSSSWIADIVGF